MAGDRADRGAARAQLYCLRRPLSPADPPHLNHHAPVAIRRNLTTAVADGFGDRDWPGPSTCTAGRGRCLVQIQDIEDQIPAFLYEQSRLETTSRLEVRRVCDCQRFRSGRVQRALCVPPEEGHRPGDRQQTRRFPHIHHGHSVDSVTALDQPGGGPTLRQPVDGLRNHHASEWGGVHSQCHRHQLLVPGKLLGFLRICYQ